MKRALIPLALAAAALGSPALAQDAAPQPDMTRAQALQRADSLFDMFDRRHEGVVTRHEAKAVGRKLLLQRAALHRDVAPGLGGHTLKYLEHRFAGVHSVTREQFEQAMLDHFDDMDVNHDGILTAAERAQASDRISATADE